MGNASFSSIDINPPVNNIFLAFFQDRLQDFNTLKPHELNKALTILKQGRQSGTIGFSFDFFNGDECTLEQDHVAVCPDISCALKLGLIYVPEWKLK